MVFFGFCFDHLSGCIIELYNFFVYEFLFKNLNTFNWFISLLKKKKKW